MPEIQLSVVIPMFNEEGNIPALMTRLLATCRQLTIPWEIVCVNDGSKDRTPELIRGYQAEAPQVVLVDFVRNFGQHAAVTAGFAHARGKWIITLDADLQNPPEEIPNLVQCFEQGHDLINTIRRDRQDTWFRKTASKFTNQIVRKMSGIKLNDFGCMLRGYSREVAQQVVRCRERRTFIPALASLFAARPIEIQVSHAERAVGESKYPLSQLLSLQLDLITNFSIQPLRLLFLTGFAFALLGIALGTVLLIGRLFIGAEWAANGVLTILGFLLIFMGGQFFALGLVGEYVGRILLQVRLREPFVVGTVERPGEAIERPGVGG